MTRIYDGTNEEFLYDKNDPDKFWKKGIRIFNNTIQLEGYETTEVHIKHRALKYMMTDEHLIDFNVKDVWYSKRNPDSEKYIMADLSYPVFLCNSHVPSYRYIIMDGHTRVNKAIHRGFSTFKGYLFPYEELEKHMLFWSSEQQKIIIIYEQRKLMGK